jgi:hypothetical protein
MYGPMIYTVPYVMFLMRENPLQGKVVGGWAQKIETFMGKTVKWQRAVRRLPFGAQKHYLCRLRMTILLDLVECSNEEGPGPINSSRRFQGLPTLIMRSEHGSTL